MSINQFWQKDLSITFISTIQGTLNIIKNVVKSKKIATLKRDLQKNEKNKFGRPHISFYIWQMNSLVKQNLFLGQYSATLFSYKKIYQYMVLISVLLRYTFKTNSNTHFYDPFNLVFQQELIQISLQQYMWFKQAANSVWNATKNIISDNRSPVCRLLDEIVDSPEEIIPTTKLNELSALTYNIQSFQEIVDLAINRIKVFKYDIDEARKNLNMLITINYLIKHGASAFVDELREFIPTFKKYQALQVVKTYENETEQSTLDYQLEKIKSRAQHIQTLLEDKQKLLKEKELSMLIKQKLKLYEKEKTSDIKSMSARSNDHADKGTKDISASQTTQNDRMGKLEWMMEKYLWQYVDKLDGKIEEASQKVMKQVDKYILGEMPDKFEFEDDDCDKRSPQHHQNYEPFDEKEVQLMKRLEEQGGVVTAQVNNNLLQFDQIIEQQIKHPPKVVQHQDLI